MAEEHEEVHVVHDAQEVGARERGGLAHEPSGAQQSEHRDELNVRDGLDARRVARVDGDAAEGGELEDAVDREGGEEVGDEPAAEVRTRDLARVAHVVPAAGSRRVRRRGAWRVSGEAGGGRGRGQAVRAAHPWSRYDVLKRTATSTQNKTSSSASSASEPNQRSSRNCRRGRARGGVHRGGSEAWRRCDACEGGLAAAREAGAVACACGSHHHHHRHEDGRVDDAEHEEGVPPLHDRRVLGHDPLALLHRLVRLADGRHRPPEEAAHEPAPLRALLLVQLRREGHELIVRVAVLIGGGSGAGGAHLPPPARRRGERRPRGHQRGGALPRRLSHSAAWQITDNRQLGKTFITKTVRKHTPVIGSYQPNLDRYCSYDQVKALHMT